VITYLQAIVLGILQGITELFPISSLGHSVILPWLLGWHTILSSESQAESFFLSFLVALHVATGTALIIYYRHTWVRIIKGFVGSLQSRKIDNPNAKLAWLLLAATIPAAVFGLAFEHILRTQFAKPLAAIIFLFINAIILFLGDRYQRLHPSAQPKNFSIETTSNNISQTLTLRRAMIIGVAQIGALFAGISRSGITMVSGLYSGLNYEDAARFSFLLATPIIFGAGLYKLPDFFSNLDAGVRGPILVGALVTGISAYLSVRFLDKYFADKTLRPFAIYSLVVSCLALVIGLFKGF